MSNFDVIRGFRANFAADTAEPLRARAPLAIALGAVVCVVGMSLVGPLVPKSAADDAGIFAFLFGQFRQAPQAYRPYVGQGLAPRIDPIVVMRHRRVATKAARPAKVTRRRIEPTVVAAQKSGAQQPVTALTDTTMRRGDAMMTERGIRVFRGARHFPFEMADFQPLSSAGKVAHRGSLLAIDHVVRAPLWSAAWKPTSPLVELPHLRRGLPIGETASISADAKPSS